MKVEISQEIQKSPVLIFPWIAEPEKAKTWQKNIQSYEIINKTENLIGTTFKETITEETGSIDMYGSIIEFEKNKKVVFHLDSRVHELDVSYLLEPINSGASVKVNSIIKWKFPMNVISFFTGKSIKREIVKQLELELLELKRICEKD